MASTTVISDDISFIQEVWDNMHNWMDDSDKREHALKLLNEFDSNTQGYWFTDEEELFLDEITHTIESYS